MFNTVYNDLPDEEIRRILRRIRNARTQTVVCRETCPCCGRKLVNLYRKSVSDPEWKCRACWKGKGEES